VVRIGATPRLGLLNEAVDDTVIGADDWNRLTDSVDNLAGRSGTDLHGQGIVAGWTFDAATKQIRAGVGYLSDGLRVATSAPQAVTGFINGEAQNIYAVATGTSADQGAVAFTAGLVKPYGAALLHVVTLDGGGVATVVNGAAPGTYDYAADADILPICRPTKITDSIEITAAPVGREFRFTVDHAVLGRFAFAEAPALTYLPGIRVTLAPDYAANGTGFAFFFEVLSAGEAVILEDNSVSTVYAWGRGAPPATVDVTFSWTRRGFLLPGIVAPS
jgi:hypothetical protein